MASRRTRIKGVAKIPQRKKTSNVDSTTDTISDDCSKTSKEKLILNYGIKPNEMLGLQNDSFTLNEVATTDDTPYLNQEVSHIVQDVSENPVKTTSDLFGKLSDEETLQYDDSKSFDAKASPKQNIPSLNLKDNLGSPVNENCRSDIGSREAENVMCLVKEENISNTMTSAISKAQTNNIRKFLKPRINLNSAKKRIIYGKEIIANSKVQDEIQEPLEHVTNKESQSVKINTEVPNVGVGHERSNSEQDNIKDVALDDINGSNYFLNQNSQQPEVTLNETHLFPSKAVTVNHSETNLTQEIKKVLPDTQNINVSDSEYPVPPSPTKINRCRIKAVPRLSQRKTSFSASESEDESRKYGRIRNNSVCSVASVALEPSTTTESLPPKEVLPVLQKKVNRTEQSRKLAEARKEFQKRFGSNSPDKQSLKMIDFIFYNPTSNPMSQKKSKNQSENIDINENVESEKQAEESVDEPPQEVDVENNMPVPQIKIGPSGEIILDEKSLIVENAEVKKQKEKMQKSQVVDGDFDTGYGIYKRAKRSKDWTQQETLRFYKALNLIGTDFTVMSHFFPKRTRRELKMKFKKEENINRHLIDRAIMQPCNYNISTLKREAQIEEEEQEALQKLKEHEMNETKRVKQDKQMKRERKRKVKEPETADKPSKPKKSKSKPLNIKSVLADSDADVSDMETQSESEEEMTRSILQPTRSGRMPKSTQRYTHHPKTAEPAAKILRKQRSLSVESNPENFVPGSVVIMAEEDPDGKLEYKSFMVTPEKTLTPLKLESDMISVLIKEKPMTDCRTEAVSPLISEQNITIPAGEDGLILSTESHGSRETVLPNTNNNVEIVEIES